MNIRTFSLSLAFIGALGWTATSLGKVPPAPTVTILSTFDYAPTSNRTEALGISNRGEIAGYVEARSGRANFGFTGKAEGNLGPRFFFSSDGQKESTVATGINTSGQVCGYYYIQSVQHGFLRNGPTFTAYDVPGSLYTYIEGENDAGDFVGTYLTIASGLPTAFVNSGGTVTDIVVPRAQYATAGGINNAGGICGDYRAEGFNYLLGFYEDAAGTFTTGLSYPGGLDTSLNGINDAGTIVGAYTDAVTTQNRGLVLILPNTYISFDVPGALWTSAWGINNAGVICGAYSTSDLYIHGFIAQLSTGE